MNAKFNLVLFAVTMSFIATACTPEISAQPILDQAQPKEASYETVPLVPVTGVNAVENAYDYGPEARAYPSQRLHSACASEDLRRQGKCEEQKPNAVIRHSNNVYSDTQDYPSQKLHSYCVSEDIHRQNNCMG